MLNRLVRRLAEEPIAADRAFLTWLVPYSLAVVVALIGGSLLVEDILEPVWPGAADYVARALVIVGIMVGAWYSDRVAIWLDRRFAR